MILVIDDHKTIEDLQDKFNECFPYLKIEFYEEGYSRNSPSQKSNAIPINNKIGNIRNNHNPGLLVIKSWDQTGKAEQDFKLFYGLNVKILSFYNQQWTQLAHSRELTLAEQSERAKRSLEKIKKSIKPIEEKMI